jgi:hypothetical protein
MTALLIGLGLALVVGAFARLVGFDRDRAFYPTVLIVVGSYYILFAAMAGSGIPGEIAFFLLFAVTAVAAFRITPWFAAAGLAAHGIFDFVRHEQLPAPGAPLWWPAFCGGFDVAAAVVLAAVLIGGRRRLRSPQIQPLVE